MTRRRPWNRLRKLAAAVLVVGAFAFVVVLVTRDAILQIIALVLVLVASLLNLASLPTDQ